MIYAIQYQPAGLSRKEDAHLQKELSKRVLTAAIRTECGTEPDFSQISFGPHGKPFFQNLDIHYNITHCKGLVCCAAGPYEIGVDAETIRPYRERRTERVCTQTEKEHIESSDDVALEFIKFWTLKESYLKYTGDGLGFGAKNVAFYYKKGRPYLIGKDIFIRQQIFLLGKETYVIALCAEKETDSQIKFIEATAL